MTQQCAEKDAQITILNGLRSCDNLESNLKSSEEQYNSHYKHLEEDYRRNCVEKHKQNFDKCVGESDEMYRNAQGLMQQLAEKLQAKKKQVKEIKQVIGERKQKLKEISNQKYDVHNQLLILSASKTNEIDKLENMRVSSNRLKKDVNRLMTERIDLQKLERKMREQLRQMASNCKQLTEEMHNDSKEISKLKEKLSTYSSSFIRNKRLSDSVDLDQSKLESFLNYEKETKQELLSEVNEKKRVIERFRSINKSYSRGRFISSDLDAESAISEDSQLVSLDFADLTSESKHLRIHFNLSFNLPNETKISECLQN